MIPFSWLLFSRVFWLDLVIGFARVLIKCFIIFKRKQNNRETSQARSRGKRHTHMCVELHTQTPARSIISPKLVL